MASAGQQPGSLNIQLLVDSIPALIHTATSDGYLDYFNKPWLEYLGATLEQVSGWNWKDFIHPEDLDGIVEKWLACLASGEVFEYETRVRRADGEYRWMFHRKVPLRDERGNIVKWYGSSLDIEERKSAEEQLQRNARALQRSEFYLAEGQRLGHMGSWAFSTEGFYYWSPELFRMHGLDPASKPPSVKEYLDRVHPQDRESMADLIDGLAVQASPFDAIKRIVRPDGEVRHIRCVGVPLADSQSLKIYVGSAIDVTKHQLLTEELRRREADLAEAQRLSQTGSWAWSPDKDIRYWSEECYRVLSFDPQDGLPRFEEFFQRVHTDDQPGFTEVIQTAIRDKAEWEADYRIVHPDGPVRDIHVIGHPVLSASGDLIEFVGTVIDVTERRRAEEERRRSEMELRQILDLAPQIIAVYG
ncbi:MAG: PAS domain-containing protein, partial [Candidatus Acidiferrales bacterium]